MAKHKTLKPKFSGMKLSEIPRRYDTSEKVAELMIQLLQGKANKERDIYTILFQDENNNALNIKFFNEAGLNKARAEGSLTTELVKPNTKGVYIGHFSYGKMPKTPRKDIELAIALAEEAKESNIEVLDYIKVTKERSNNIYKAISFNEENLIEKRSITSHVIDEKERLKSEIESVLNGSLRIYQSIKICDNTPQILQDVGLENKPILMSQSHVRKCIEVKGNNPHHHGLKKEDILCLPERLSSPAIIMDSFSQNNCIIAVFDAVDLDNLPIMASIRTNGQGIYEVNTISSNYLTSIYGKDNFYNFLKRSIDNDMVLFVNKEKIKALSTCSKLQLRGAFSQGFNYDTIIHRSNNIVNESGKNKLSVKEEAEEYKASSQMNERRNEMGKDRVYVRVYKDYARLGEMRNDGKGTYNMVTLPKGVTLGDTDLSGGKVFPSDKFVFQDTINKNLITMAFTPEQKVDVHLREGNITVNATELSEAVKSANERYMSERQNDINLRKENEEVEKIENEVENSKAYELDEEIHEEYEAEEEEELEF